ncbi:MAG: restriction endonuclease [Marinovum algicola]|uniref:McrC family protein n=1 Tax=Alphaproteobacteria TaxID=28211 RepID=UPI0032EAD3C5
MIYRQLPEWGRIGFGDCSDTIPEAAAARLAAVASRSPLPGRNGEGILEFRRNDLRVRGVVGVIAAPGCQLEVLPKIEALGEQEADAATLRRRLVHMLSLTRDLRIEALTSAELGWQKDTLLEILIRIFCQKMMDAVRQGMPRRYIGQEEDLAALRGRLDVTRQFSTLAAAPQRLACQYHELSADIALNQVMKAAIRKLSGLATASDTQRSLRELSFAYADISDIPVSALRWDQIVLDRSSQRWGDLLALAQLLLGERYQTTSTGVTQGHALLFEMNVLFEAYVSRLARRALAGSRLRVRSQGGRKACLYEESKGLFQTRPDILVTEEAEVRVIIDTKWKRIAPQIDDPKQGINQGDVYQLMAYAQLYDCPRVVLLYPHHARLGSECYQRLYHIGLDGPARLCVATLDVSSPHAVVTAHLERLVRAQAS